VELNWWNPSVISILVELNWWNPPIISILMERLIG